MSDISDFIVSNLLNAGSLAEVLDVYNVDTLPSIELN
jgi:hypothetical protein